MLTPSRGARRRTAHVVEEWAMQIDTSGGSNDTEVNELAVMPTGTESTIAAIAVTPEGKTP